MTDRHIYTYQTRPALTPVQHGLLGDWATLHGQAERTLFAALQAGTQTLNELKHDFQKRFGITARQFNAIRIGLEGKIAAIKERRPELISEAQTRIKRAQKVITKLKAMSPGSNKLHQKKRRLKNLEDRLANLQADHKSGTVRMCFGSKKLFRAQFNLEANGYASVEDWKQDWRNARSNQFFVLGSGDESAGNQTCQASVAGDGSLTLILRLPDALNVPGKRMTITGVRFAYGHDAVLKALLSGQRIAAITKTGKQTVKRTGAALSYRFVRDDTGWRILLSVDSSAESTAFSTALGAFGIDINADHLALAETDRFGNLVRTERIPLNTYGKTPDQTKALIGDAAVAIAAAARTAGKPVVIEQLNFARKKAELEAAEPKQARMLSSFACNKVVSAIKSACFRSGIAVIAVNPAYTSVIGAVNYARRYGISVHQGAAHAIARRGLGLSETPPVHQATVPACRSGHVTFLLPARNRKKHVWSYWAVIRTRLKAAHAAHFRSDKAKAKPAPLRQSNPASCAIRIPTVQSRGANRFQHCSGNVIPDVPH